VRDTPLDYMIGFWKPIMDPQELKELAGYRDPDEPPVRGINALRVGSEARRYRLAHAGTESTLFAAVHPIEEVPPSAEIVADILDGSGEHYSYVLWFPDDGSVVVPFDPNAAVEAFRREEYVPPAKRTALPKPLLAIYYAVKPLLPLGVTQRLRRSMAHRALASADALEWPVDESLDLLQRLLLGLVMTATGRQELEFAWFWPDKHPWAVVLTHDVETAGGLANVPRVAEMERGRGLRSSFNLVPRDYEAPESLLRSLGAGGFEIGVHGYTHDGLLFSKWSTFQERVVAINEYGRRWGASGFRSPATYRNLEWFHLLEFEYDSSVSNTAPCEPQPGGCGSFFPYPVDDMVELPITLPQDHTLFELLEETDAKTWLACLERIRRANGMACVLAHPDLGPGYIRRAENETRYAGLLDAVAGSDAWKPLPRDLVRWWRARAEAPLDGIAALEGVSFGRAVLTPSGHVEIVPPAR
jgi:peptidoglycan/xylan/chitin deacetylase (PgdA/CDA1 family)